MDLSTPPIEGASDRYRQKRERILDAADHLISEKGLKGLTFVGVGEAVGLNTTSITYYFKRKEQLAGASIERSIDRLRALAAEAGRAPDPRARVDGFVRLHMRHAARVRSGEEKALAILSEIRALEDPIRAALIQRYWDLRGELAGFFGPADGAEAARSLARGQILLDTLHWTRAWLPAYALEDFPRAGDRMIQLYAQGLAAPGAIWAPAPLEIEPAEPEDPAEPGPETFLRAATQLINERGYRGASVERIAARLGVSKGSFYHHLPGKDQLVLACFERSYERVSRAQRLAMALPGDGWTRLSACIAALLRVQFEGAFPLLRVTALQALPPDLRLRVLRRLDRMSLRWAGMMSDGITDGSIRAVDPIIAAQSLTAMINGAGDVRGWAQEHGSLDAAAEVYASVLGFGMFDG